MVKGKEGSKKAVRGKAAPKVGKIKESSGTGIRERVGRPSKCTPETVSRLTDAIKTGATYELACKYAGIAYSTFREWLKAGEDADAGEFLELMEAIKAAEGAAAYGWLEKIEKAADSSWQAAAWKLERRYPQEYGRTVHELQGKGGGAIQQRVIFEVVDGSSAADNSDD